MPKNKRKRMRSKRERLKEFLRPTEWKLLALVLLYFGGYFLSLFGVLLNYPIYALFYWNGPPAGIDAVIAFAVHVAYLYLLSCVIVRVLK